MAGYTYTAIDKFGKEKRGSIEAISMDGAATALKAEGLVPIKVQEASVFNQDTQIKNQFVLHTITYSEWRAI